MRSREYDRLTPQSRVKERGAVFIFVLRDKNHQDVIIYCLWRIICFCFFFQNSESYLSQISRLEKKTR